MLSSVKFEDEKNTVRHIGFNRYPEQIPVSPIRPRPFKGKMMVFVCRIIGRFNYSNFVAKFNQFDEHVLMKARKLVFLPDFLPILITCI